MKVVLTPYNVHWPGLFEQEKTRLLEAIENTVLTIEHIGSTAVPGLAAKPIIDMMMGVQASSMLDALIVPVQQLGYTYYPQDEEVMPYRRFFKKLKGPLVTHHLHIVQIDSEFWCRHLLFRDYLRKTPSAVRQYAELKQALSAKEWDDSNDYAEAKSSLIRAIEQSAENGMSNPSL